MPFVSLQQLVRSLSVVVLAVGFTFPHHLLVSAQEGEDVTVIPDGVILCTEGSDDFEACNAQNRYCLVIEMDDATSSNGTSLCGPCLEGFIDVLDPNTPLQTTTSTTTSTDTNSNNSSFCISIDNIMTIDFLETFAPNYRGLDTALLADTPNRVEALRESLLLIARNQQSNSFSANLPDLRSILTFELGLTEYSADTEEDYQHRSGFVAESNRAEDEWASQLPEQEVTVASVSEQDLPPTIDWVTAGAVTEVKNQGRCGCCWATAMVGAIEGAAAANPDNKGYLQNLSWQQLISCNESNGGCNGGSLVSALGYSWLNLYGGISRNNEYPFSDFDGSTSETCEVDDKPLAVTVGEPSITLDFGPPFAYQERVLLMKQALQIAPVAMVIKSACSTLSNYRKGILNDDGNCACSSSSCLDHAVLMVGYDDTTDPPSWRLKNSWGTGWGEDGYFFVSQEEKGSWGLFGVMAHGVQAQLATNVTAAVPDDDLDEPLPFWAWLLIAFGSVSVCMFCLKIVRDRMGGNGEDYQQ